MNKLKLISVTVLCALALSACVDDKESASVTALREAKTSYLKAQADYQTAQAEVAKINAEVAKAKAEAEVAIARLQAEAEAAKTEAEAAKIRQEAEAAAKRFEIQLIELEAQAKAQAAMYEQQYQEYLNQLAQAKRDAETEKQSDLSEMIDAYQISLGNIKAYEQTIQAKELEKAKIEQSKLEVMAGQGLAKAKLDSIKQQAMLNGAQAQLEKYQVLFEAEAAKQKEIVEKVRATLSEQAQKVGEAQAAYVAKRQEGMDLKDGEWEDLADSLRKGWKVLNAAEAGYYVSDFSYTQIVIAGHSKPIFGDYVSDFNYIYGNNGYNIVKYYTWEADRLIADITAELTTATKAFEAADTLAGYNDYLKTFYDAFEKAETAYNKAVKDTKAAQKAVDALPSDATQAQIDAANQKLTNAQTAEGLALIKKTDAQVAYETERAKLNTLERNLEFLKGNVDNYTNLLAAVKDAKALCFGEIVTKIKALDEQIETLYDEYQELYSEYYTLKNNYDSDKQLVDMWDGYVFSDNNPDWESIDNTEFMAKVEQYIIIAKGDVETYKLKLANIIDMMMDPDAIAKKYYAQTLIDIKAAQDAIDVAKQALEKEEMLTREYKACIDAWMTGSAE